MSISLYKQRPIIISINIKAARIMDGEKPVIAIMTTTDIKDRIYGISLGNLSVFKSDSRE